MIWIHGGLHKTGSSAIQNYLETHSRSFRYDPQARYWLSRPEVPYPHLRYLKKRARCGSVVISSEWLLGSPENGYKSACQRVRKVASRLEGEDWRIILYFRPQIDWLESLYSQKIKTGSVLAPSHFVHQVGEQAGLEWGQLVKRLASEFGSQRFAIRCYRSEDLMEDFFRVTKQSVGGDPDRRVNERISCREILIQREFNLYIKDSGCANKRDLCRAAYGLLPQIQETEKKSFFSEKDQVLINRRFREDRRSMLEIFRRQLPDISEEVIDFYERSWEERPFQQAHIKKPSHAELKQYLQKAQIALSHKPRKRSFPRKIMRRILRILVRP